MENSSEANLLSEQNRERRMTILKQSDQKTALNLFDVADSSRKETSLSKILAYLMSTELAAFEGMLNTLEITIERTTHEKAWRSSKISIENSYTADELGSGRKGGRTDIEIIFSDGDKKYDIIIECKTKAGKATIDQYQLYKPVFDQRQSTDRMFVYLSHQSGINLLSDDKIKVIDVTWRDLINSLSAQLDEFDQPRSELTDFLEYYERSYGMTQQKEILVQDLGDETEIKRFQNCVYRRDKVNRSPLYFAPYITRKGAQHSIYPEGMSQISKILGIITSSRESMVWENIKASCENFVSKLSKKNGDDLLKKWEDAVELRSHADVPEQVTYYFLDEPTTINPSLLKDNNRGEGQGKGWIAAMIPKNRMITFASLLEQMNKQRSN